MERIRLTASEEMSFENVDGRRTDDGRTPDACIYYKLTCEPTGSGELKSRGGGGVRVDVNGEVKLL